MNEDYMRGLLDRAVTKWRSKLISFIKKGGKCPEYFDKPIWDRLVMLADSKQREKRTKHGRYANSCHRTFGRTSPSGGEGVFERLRDVYGRSLDPEEVHQEMERDKGFGRMGNTLSEKEKLQGNQFPSEMFEKDDRILQSEIYKFKRVSKKEDEYGEDNVDFVNRNKV